MFLHLAGGLRSSMLCLSGQRRGWGCRRSPKVGRGDRGLPHLLEVSHGPPKGLVSRWRGQGLVHLVGDLARSSALLVLSLIFKNSETHEL